MKEISTEIEIDASAERVWQVLTDFSSFPDWNPFVQSLEGAVREGERIKVRLKGMTFRPTVLKFEPNSEFRWRALLPHRAGRGSPSTIRSERALHRGPGAADVSRRPIQEHAPGVRRDEPGP